MDTGENKLDAEMMKKIYESYKLHQKEDYEKFVEDCKKIIYVSDRESSDIEDILKLVKGTLITDNHERRIHDSSYKIKLTGSQVLNLFFDEPYPKIDILTGCTQNFKVQQKIDKLEALYDILNTEAPDRNGRIWKTEVLKGFMNNKIYLTTPRGHKSWLWLKLLELQKSYEVRLQNTLGTPPSTKFELKSVIHMRWPKPNMSNLKRNFRYGKMMDDQALINYAGGDVSHIDMMILDSLATFGPDINSGYGMSTPNLNDIDKKKLERVIKRRKKK